jgi:hypothetical protein
LANKGATALVQGVGENPSSCQDSVEEIGRLESLSLQRQGIEQGFGVR